MENSLNISHNNYLKERYTSIEYNNKAKRFSILSSSLQGISVVASVLSKAFPALESLSMALSVGQKFTETFENVYRTTANVSSSKSELYKERVDHERQILDYRLQEINQRSQIEDKYSRAIIDSVSS